MKNPRVISANQIRYLFSPHRPGVGVSYADKRLGDRPYDIGEATCHDGKYIITWGLNLRKDQLLTGNTYVKTMKCLHPPGLGWRHEMVIAKETERCRPINIKKGKIV